MTPRDVQILEVLTKRVRVLSLDQIARTWWTGSSNPPRIARERLRTLSAQGLVEVQLLPAYPELPLTSPVLSWHPKQVEPDFGAVSFKLQSRWKKDPVLTTCVSATKLAVSRFGGHGGRAPRAVELSHDIHMAAVFLRYRERHPEILKHWTFEEQVKAERRRDLAPRGLKLPDAFLRLPEGSRAVEFGGAYSKEKLLAFHAYCKEYQFPYEIW